MDGRWRPSRWMATLVVLLAGCSATGSAPATSSTSVSEPKPTTAVIVFERGWGEQAEIVSLDPVTLEEQVLSEGGQAHFPAVNDAGTHLAWAGPSETDPTWPDVFVRDLDSGDVQRVGSGGAARWTHDQEALLVARPDGLYRLELDGSASRVVPGSDVGGSELTPGVFIVDAGGEDAEALAIIDGAESTLIYEEEGCASTAWEVDASARLLVFDVSCDSEEDERAGLYLHDLRVGTTDQLISGSVLGASWAPDGASIVTVREPASEGEEFELLLVDTSGQVTDVFSNAASIYWPVWAEVVG